ncbi:hypothetical protein [Rhodococcus sp. NPDC059234]|uniref:hypothetical protein n=1 Tax=Rhodococcus sp. NPDC059234 TaxID=3346781 RepID=UPI00366B089A
MRAGGAPAWLNCDVPHSNRPDPGALLVPLLTLVAALAAPLVVPIPVAFILVAAAAWWFAARVRLGGPGVAPARYGDDHSI